ncbi:serine protease [Komagataeibacter saccharivorans]|uniref:S1 family peptidase n=1 Tax=Komagataeibacter saccharivorans TaxID=265959 RepID=UPI000D7B9F4A|nr:serine protease [Komagataeibacter saccharivorans]PYD49619.1 serine protease [Komagataeibacter saccharivorans]
MDLPKYIDPISLLIHSTVRIHCFSPFGKNSYGTGYIYFFRKKDGTFFPGIVTNKHVINGATDGSFNLTLATDDGGPDLGRHESIHIKHIDKTSIYHPNPNIDLAVIPIGEILDSAENNGKNYFYVPISENLIPPQDFLSSLSPIEDIIMIGYPNGLWDAFHNLPIVRRGITASHPKLNLNGNPEFLIDAACFPGSSGSPVFLANRGAFLTSEGDVRGGTRVAFLGTLWGGPEYNTIGQVEVVNVPNDTKSIAKGKGVMNLGLVIRSAELAVLENCIGITPPRYRNSSCPCGSGKRFKSCCGRIGRGLSRWQTESSL